MRSAGLSHFGRAVALAAALSIVSTGCAPKPPLTAPISKFRNASAVVIESTKGYLIALNKTERDLYIDNQVAARGPIQLLKIEEVQVFSAEAIAARLEALDRLADYTELLFRLATSDAPETVKGKARDLNEALSGLSGKVSALAGADDARFTAAAAKVFPVIGTVLKAIVERQIEAALKEAVTAGAAPVNELIEAVKIDSELAYQRKRNALSKRRSDAALQYNREFQTPSGDPAALRGYADIVSITEDQWEAFQTARPVEGLDAMQRANLALETFAKAPRPTVTDFASFVDAVEVFASAAARVGQGLQELLKLQERIRK